MSRFDAFHMYGVIGLSIVVAMIPIQVIKKWNVKDNGGNSIVIPDKDSAQTSPYLVGGTVVRPGWVLAACTGLLFMLTRTGYGIKLIPIANAVLGTWVIWDITSKTTQLIISRIMNR